MVQILYYLTILYIFYTSFYIIDNIFFPEYGTCINKILLVSFNKFIVVASIKIDIIIDAIGSAK